MPTRRAIVAALVALLSLVVPMAGPAHAAPPPNDERADAVRITSLPFTHSTDTREATVAPDDPSAGCVNPLATVWYMLRLDRSRQVVITTFGSSYDTTLSVFTMSGGVVTPIACNDDNQTLQAAVTFLATAGTRYWIMAGTCCGGPPGHVGPGGDLVLNATVAPPPVRADLTVDGEGTVDRDGVATVTGTVRCNVQATAEVYVRLRQIYDRHIASGDQFAVMPCGPRRSAWSVEVHTFTSVVFGPGGADVDALLVARDPLTSDQESVQTEIRLRRSPASPSAAAGA